LPSVSLVIIDTENYTLSYKAVEESIKAFDFSDILIFSDNDTCWGDHSIIKIPKIKSYFDYNDLILNKLPEFAKTDFCLIIQYDGYILNPNQFSESFFNYDYIGAPWPWHKANNVGNGGFSLRSKKLINALKDLKYSEKNTEPEDDFFCRVNRLTLESEYGCRFATENIAAQFSIEHGSRDFPTFGFHGVWHLVKIYKDNIDYFLNNIPRRLLKSDMHFYFIHQEMKLYLPERLNDLIEIRKKCFSFFNFKRYRYFKKVY
jgi:hypothetical protein